MDIAVYDGIKNELRKRFISYTIIELLILNDQKK